MQNKGVYTCTFKKKERCSGVRVRFRTFDKYKDSDSFAPVRIPWISLEERKCVNIKYYLKFTQFYLFLFMIRRDMTKELLEPAL